MKRTAQPLDDSVLFDLPLVAEPELANKPRPQPKAESHVRIEAEAETQLEVGVELAEPEQFSLEARPETDESESAADDLEEDNASPLRRRLVAGAIDTAVLAAALGLMVVGTAALGIRPALSHLPSYALVGLVLSFLYAGFSLLFWGKTPGMQRTGLMANSLDGSPVTLGQVVRRWIGGVCTVALFGLPTLLDLGGGGTLSDRISGSRIEP